MNQPDRSVRILPALDPPSGGWERLLARRDSRNARIDPWLSFATGSAAAVLLLMLTMDRTELKLQWNGARLMGARSEGIGLRILEQGRATPLPSGNPAVRLYWVESAPEQ